jgi:Archaeal/vacuolar-type H+-ATPase subunit C
LRSLYGLPYGTLKVEKLNLLSKKDYEDLIKASSVNDIISLLSEKGLKDDLSQYSNQYSGLDLIEISNNSYFARLNRYALSVTPYNGKDLIVSYLSKWDLLNLKTIIAAKSTNNKIEQTQIYLITSKNLPVGMYAGLLSYEDYRNILSMDNIEDIVSYTLRYGYGKALLSFIDDYKKNNNVTSLLLSLDLYYYEMMREKFRFFNGSEGPIYRYIKRIIDSKNLMTILKGIEYGNVEDIKDFIIKGGGLTDQQIDDLIKSNSVEEVIQKVKNIFNITTGLDYYKNTSSLVGIESEIERNIYWEFLEIFEMSSLSINNVIAFLMRAEAQWKDIKKIASGKFYNLSEEEISMLLINKVI